MFTFGPWLGLCKMLGGEVGKKMGRVVVGDMKRFEQIADWSHADKIKELVTDRGLSPSYLKELIQNSKPADLPHIDAYLKDSLKAGNLGTLRESLMKSLKEKIIAHQDSEILKQLIQQAREGVEHLL